MLPDFMNQLLTPLIFSVFAIGFATIWYNYRQFVSAGMFAVSYSCAALAFGLEAVVVKNDAIASIAYMGDALYIAASAMFALGICEKFGGKLPLQLLTAGAAILFMAATWYRFVDFNVELRAIWISIGSGVLLLIAVFNIWSKITRPVDRVIFWLLTVFGAQFFITPIATLHVFDESLTAANFDSSVFFAALSFIVSALALSLAVTLFIKFGIEIIKVLQGQTRTDELSGLLNRRGFENEMRLLITDQDIPFACNALIVCDLDHFKKVNDRFGHETGDKAISTFAGILKAAGRKSDLLGRVGGEEFCMFLPDTTDAEAAAIAEDVRHAYSNTPIAGIGPEFRMTASFGIAHCRGANYQTLFRRADAALYRAKQLGRDRVEADSARTAIIRRADPVPT